MKARQLVPAFAALIGEPAERVKVADRALADAGMRAKGRGRVPPDVTAQDVIRLLLGVFGSRYLSRAHEHVASLTAFRLSRVAFDHCEVADPALALQSVTGLTDTDVSNQIGLLSALEKVCKHVAESHGPDAPIVELEIDLEGPVAIQFDGDGIKGQVFFIGVLSGQANHNVRVSAHVSRQVLAWIGSHFRAEGAD